MAEPRPAASVVLVRPGRDRSPAESAEVFLLERHAGMAFAAGMAVFPGGAVDSADAEGWDPGTWTGPDASWWSARLGVDASRARAVVAAAVRETLEETGVLVASAPGAVPGPVVHAAEWQADRAALTDGRVSLAEVLRRRGLALRSDLLTPLACWVTPVARPRRYRTWFFRAELPEGQEPRLLTSEADRGAWWRLGDAIDAHRDGRLALMPPQEHMLLGLYADLAGLPSAAAPAAGDVPVPVVTPVDTGTEPGAPVEGPPALRELARRVAEARAAVSR